VTAPILVPDETKAILDERGGEWAIYQNLALDSAGAGHLQFMRFGEGCTYIRPPPCMPDGVWGAGWKYVLSGVYKDGRAYNRAECLLELNATALLAEMLDTVRYPVLETYQDPFATRQG